MEKEKKVLENEVKSLEKEEKVIENEVEQMEVDEEIEKVIENVEKVEENTENIQENIQNENFKNVQQNNPQENIEPPSITKKYQLDDSLLESSESEYESATEQSFDLTPMKPPVKTLDLKDVQVSETVDDIADIFSGMKLESAVKKSPNEEDRETTPTPQLVDSICEKPSEVDDILAQLKNTDVEEDDTEIRQKLLDLSLPPTNSIQEECIKPSKFFFFLN